MRDLNRENRAEPGYLLSWMGNKGNLSYLYILNSGILQTCRTCTLSHTHTRTCVHARVEFVFATPHFDQLSAFGQTFQQRVHRACRKLLPVSPLSMASLRVKRRGKAVEQGFGSHVRRWCGGGSCGQERENVACMAVQRFHQGQHGIKVVGADGEVELRDDSVCYVFLWNMGRRGQSGTVQQGTHDVFLWLTAPSPPGSRDSRERSRAIMLMMRKILMAIRVTALFIWLP